ncbi:MAG: ABC transporter permease [Candidatus Hermodarchaeia archaeon]|jgi:peptide/nickel transport system permease protein
MSERSYKHRLSWFERASGVWSRYREVKQGIFGIALVLIFIIMAVLAPTLFPLYPEGFNQRVGPNFAAPQWMSWTAPLDMTNTIEAPTINIIPDPFFETDDSWIIDNSSLATSWAWGEPSQTIYQDEPSPGRSLEFYFTDNNVNETYRYEAITATTYFPWNFSTPGLAYAYWTVEIELTGNLTMQSIDPHFLLLNDRLYEEPSPPDPVWYTYEIYPPYPTQWQLFRGYVVAPVMNRAFRPGETIGWQIILNVTERNPSRMGEARFSIDDVQLTPYGQFWGILGTGDEGLDALAQLFWGAQVSLFIGLIATFLGVAVGLLLGLSSGYFGGAIDEVIMRVVDFFIIMPSLPIMMILAALMGSSLGIVVFVLALFAWPAPARVIRSQVLVEKEKAYVEAAKAAGAGDVYLIFKHVFPNVLTLVFVQLATGVSGAILSEAGLAFLGLTPPHVVSWGRMLQAAYLQGAMGQVPPAWWFFMPPGMCIALLSMGFVFVGYAVDKALNPRLRRL